MLSLKKNLHHISAGLFKIYKAYMWYLIQSQLVQQNNNKHKIVHESYTNISDNLPHYHCDSLPQPDAFWETISAHAFISPLPLPVKTTHFWIVPVALPLSIDPELYPFKFHPYRNSCVCCGRCCFCLVIYVNICSAQMAVLLSLSHHLSLFLST